MFSKVIKVKKSVRKSKPETNQTAESKMSQWQKQAAVMTVALVASSVAVPGRSVAHMTNFEVDQETKEKILRHDLEQTIPFGE
jgi:hypothetical protein